MITPGARDPVSDSNKTAACSFLSPTEPDCTALQNAWSTLSLRSAVDLPQASTSFKPNDPCQSAPRPSSLQIAWSCPFLPTLPSRRALGSPLKLTWARPRRLFRSACSVPEHKKHEHGDCLAAFAVGARATTETLARCSRPPRHRRRRKITHVLKFLACFHFISAFEMGGALIARSFSARWRKIRPGGLPPTRRCCPLSAAAAASCKKLGARRTAKVHANDGGFLVGCCTSKPK